MTAAASEKAPPPISMRSVVAVIIGNWFEFYDFIVYTFFTAMIAKALMPPGEGAIFFALLIFWFGFFARPVGAAVIGAYGDRAGRKAALTLTLTLMALGSAIVGLTPTYASAGIWAPIILLIGRLIQGFSCGGEVGPATAYLMEAAPANRRAALTSWQGLSQQLATICGAGIGVILAFALSTDDLFAWGWRIPFLVGILIAPVGLYIRRQLPETISEGEKHESATAVLWHLVRHHSTAVTLGIFVICGGTVSTYIFNYMSTYAIAQGISTKVSALLPFTAALAAMPGLWLGAALADALPRKPVLVLTRLAYIAAIWPAWLIIASIHGSDGEACGPSAVPFLESAMGLDLCWLNRDAMMLIGLNAGLSFIFSTGIGGSYAFLTEAFPKPVRASGLAILYALAVTIFGGSTQLIVNYLKDNVDPMSPAWYQIAANVAATIAVILLVAHKDSPQVTHREALASREA